MLTHLRIQHFVLVDALEIDFQSGFCLLTGETGAGKSLVIAALSGVTGGRLSTDQIRQGHNLATLESSHRPAPDNPVWDLLDEHGIDHDGEIVLTRTLSDKGSRCRVNGQQVTLQVLKEIGEHLIEIVGQHDHHRLLRSDQHLALLDALGDSSHRQALQQLARDWQRLKEWRRRLKVSQEGEAERLRQLDFWRFQLEEIDDVQPRPGEDDQLRQEFDRLSHVETLQAAYLDALNGLVDGEFPLIDALGRVSQSLKGVQRFDDTLSDECSQLAGVQDQLRELSRQIRHRLENLSTDPETLSQVTDRLDQLSRLKKKYGPHLDDVLRFREEIAAQVAAADSDEASAAGLARETERQERAFQALAAAVRKRRQALAQALEASVQRELTDLGMGQCRFEVACAEQEPGPRGLDSVQFNFSGNPGEPLKPLAKVASGGETSRLLLALRTALHKADPTPTLVFDEVDTGIGGAAARTVAEKLAALAREAQLVCITHLPAVAAMADQHLKLTKRVDGNRTLLAIASLDEDERLYELAQMASGDTSKTALEHAGILARQAQTFKSGFATLSKP